MHLMQALLDQEKYAHDRWFEAEKNALGYFQNAANRQRKVYENYVPYVLEVDRECSEAVDGYNRIQLVGNYSQLVDARNRYDRCQDYLNYVKQVLDRHYQNFEADKNRFNQEADRYNDELSTKESILKALCDDLDGVKAGMLEEERVKKSQLEAFIKPLETEMKQQEEKLESDCKVVIDSLKFNYGNNYEDFYNKCMNWEEKLFVMDCGEGQESASMMRKLLFINIKKKILAIRWEHDQKKPPLLAIHSELEKEEKSIREEGDRLQESCREFQASKKKAVEEFSARTEDVKRKIKELNEELADQQRLFFEIYQAKSKLALLERGILAEMVLAKCDEDQHLGEDIAAHRELKLQLNDQISQVMMQVDVPLAETFSENLSFVKNVVEKTSETYFSSQVPWDPMDRRLFSKYH